MPVLDTGRVAAEHSCSSLDVALAELLRLAKLPYSLTDLHFRVLSVLTAKLFVVSYCPIHISEQKSEKCRVASLGLHIFFCHKSATRPNPCAQSLSENDLKVAHDRRVEGRGGPFHDNQAIAATTAEIAQNTSPPSARIIEPPALPAGDAALMRQMIPIEADARAMTTRQNNETD